MGQNINDDKTHDYGSDGAVSMFCPGVVGSGYGGSAPPPPPKYSRAKNYPGKAFVAQRNNPDINPHPGILPPLI
jgi:hypothetical protein